MRNGQITKIFITRFGAIIKFRDKIYTPAQEYHYNDWVRISWKMIYDTWGYTSQFQS